MNTGHAISFRLHQYASHSLYYALSQCSLAAGVELCIGGLMTVPLLNNELERMCMEEVVIQIEAMIFDLLTLVNVFLNIVFSWYMTPCSLLDRHQRFAGKCCLLLEDNF
jgi:hypothetical protein